MKTNPIRQAATKWLRDNEALARRICARASGGMTIGQALRRETDWTGPQVVAMASYLTGEGP